MINEETIKINIGRESTSLIGLMLVRGYSNGVAFNTRALGLVGNLRNAISYLSREGMSTEALAKVKLNRREMIRILELPRRRVANYNQIMKSVIEDRVISDKVLINEIGKYLGDSTIRLSFTANGPDGKMHNNMFRYCKILNQLMQDKNFITIVREETSYKKKPLKLTNKIINLFKGKKK